MYAASYSVSKKTGCRNEKEEKKSVFVGTRAKGPMCLILINIGRFNFEARVSSIKRDCHN